MDVYDPWDPATVDDPYPAYPDRVARIELAGSPQRQPDTALLRGWTSMPVRLVAS